MDKRKMKRKMKKENYILLKINIDQKRNFVNFPL